MTGTGKNPSAMCVRFLLSLEATGYAAGVHPKVVSERLGHSTVSITLDTYSHAIPALEEEAAARVARLVFGG